MTAAVHLPTLAFPPGPKLRERLIEKAVHASRHPLKLDKPVGDLPWVGSTSVRHATPSCETLNKFRLKVETNLDALGKFMRGQSDAVRDSLFEPHQAALKSMKLFRDDYFLVSLEIAGQPTGRASMVWPRRAR